MYKKIYLLVIFATIFASCSQPDKAEKAKKLVINYCDSNLYNPGVYKPISFKKLKAYYEPYEKTHEYAALTERKDLLNTQIDSLFKQVDSNEKAFVAKHQVDSLNKLIVAINRQISARRESFKGKQEGWLITHVYRDKNDFGAIIQDQSVFVLNNDLTKVMGTVSEE